MDNLNGPTGLFLIAGIGVMRTAVILEEVLHISIKLRNALLAFGKFVLRETYPQMKVDSVPVDTCANLTLVAAWETHKNHTNGKRDLKVGTWFIKFFS